MADNSGCGLSVASPGSFVAYLFFWCSPFAVIGAVWAVVVNSIYRVFFGWPAPHINKELLERISPLLANINSTPAVIFVPIIFFVMTSLLHGNPYSVFVCPDFGTGFPVRCDSLFLQTPTTSVLARCQVASSGKTYFSAITRAKPYNLYSVIRSALQYG